MEERVRVDRGVWMSIYQGWEMADGCVDGMVCGRERPGACARRTYAGCVRERMRERRHGRRTL